MDISRWHRNTSLLALSLSIDSAFRGDDGPHESKAQTIRKDRVRGQGSRNKAMLGLSGRLRRKRIPVS